MSAASGASSTFLLEILTEEIPANALPGARAQLADGVGTRLAEAGIANLEVQALSTSRRLCLVVRGLPDRQPDRREKVSGPPARVAFGDDGAPTKAAEGFARKLGLEVGDLERESTDKGEYVVATVLHEGRPTAEILAETIPLVVAGMRFPKTMRWGLGEHLFVRPVHGVVALLDDAIVPLELYGVTSGRQTVGHRVHSPGPVTIASAESYAATMREHKVLVDPAERRALLEQQAADLVAGTGFVVHEDPDLVAEHVELVEMPGLLRGAFDPAFLELPPEVVVVTLRHHQKCLVLESEAATGDSSDPALAPGFLAVIDREDDPEGLIRQGNEWVIGARLADARFFFDEDRKHHVIDLVPALARLDFHRRLGSIGHKAERIGALAESLARRLELDVEPATIRRTAGLVKADLLTSMVGEFPELQGVMGGHYLRLEDEPEDVWTAARDHYRPQGFDGELPTSTLGCLLGVADRLDTVAGLFAAGETPSGSKDPFGLRRAAQGAVRIIAETGWELDLEAALDDAVRLVAPLVGDENGNRPDPADVGASLSAFVAERVRRYLVEMAGVQPDTADAVMAAGWSRLPGLLARARALDEVRAEERFRALALAFKRVRNITEGQAGPEADGIDESAPADPAELELRAAAARFHERLTEHLGARRLDQAFDAMGETAEVLDRFFVEVLVMAEDPRARGNRIALLRSLGRDYLTLADLSKLHVEGGN